MLFLSFTLHLENYEIDKHVRPKGPTFHRWLPEGRADAVTVPLEDKRNRIELWFERRGYVDRGFIRYSGKRSEVDVEVMKCQGRLDGGQLWGEGEFASITTSELDAVRQDQKNSDEYIALAKRVIGFLYPPVSAFINLLRTQYGQYWLNELQPWDSRTQSLGSYCSATLWLQWREREDQLWRDFRPTELSCTISASRLPGRAFGEYLTEKDWRRIQTTFNPKESTPLALGLIGRAHELWDKGHLREAFVQAATATELAVEYFVAKRKNGQSSLVGLPEQQLFNLPLKTQIWILAIASSHVPQATLDNAVTAIELRNDIVHKGKQPNSAHGQLLQSLLECAKAFLGLDELKMPVLTTTNESTGAEYGGRQALVPGMEAS